MTLSHMSLTIGAVLMESGCAGHTRDLYFSCLMGGIAPKRLIGRASTSSNYPTLAGLEPL